MQNHVDSSRAPSSRRPSHAMLTWLGWTLAWLAASALAFIVFERPPLGQSSWWFMPVIGLSCLIAYLIGRVYPSRYWPYGPVAAVLVPAAAMVGYGMISPDPDDAYIALAGTVGLVMLGLPTLAAAGCAALGARTAQRRAQALAAEASERERGAKRRPESPDFANSPSHGGGERAVSPGRE